jgi:hypothetical protein
MNLQRQKKKVRLLSLINQRTKKIALKRIRKIKELGKEN